MRHIIPIFLLSATVTGCVDLDQYPLSSIDVDSYYSTNEEVETAVNGIYSILTYGGFYGLYNNHTVYFDDLSTEYMKAGANTNSAHIREIGNCAVQPNNQFVIDSWEWSYTGINRANIVIDQVAVGPFTAQEKLRWQAEAKILRALHYFNLVRWYGDVPLVLHDGEGEGRGRDNVDVIYQQIVQDLQDGARLPETFDGSTEGRATRYTALGLLSKVYLTWAQTQSPLGEGQASAHYAQAIAYADSIIESGKFALEEEFLDNWAVDKKNGKESLFQVQHHLDNVSGHCTFAMGFSDSEPVLILQNGTATDGSRYVYPAYERIDPRDQRKAGSFAKSLPLPDTYEEDGTQSRFTFQVPVFRKYIDTINYTLASPNMAGRSTNSSYLRYAEILLIRAEADNELNGPTASAIEALNQVRRRAYRHFPVTQASADDYTAAQLSDQEHFRWALQRERFNEFVAEGQHWFDLVRWRILVKTVREGGDVSGSLKASNIGLKNYLFPLPQPQLTLNPNLTQNWGYSGETSGSPYEGVEDDHTSALVGWTAVDSPLVGY